MVNYQFTFGNGLVLLSQNNGSVQLSTFGCGPVSFTCDAINSSNVVLASSTQTLLRDCGSLSISVSQSTLCGPGIIMVSASGAPNYTWSTGSTLSSFSLSIAQSTLLSLNSNFSSCPASASITVHNLSTFQSHSVICPGTSCTLTAAAAPVYNWFQPPGVLVAGGTAGQVVLTPTVLPQTYTVYGFFGTTCIVSKTMALVPYNYLPRSTAPSSVCPSTPFTITALGTNSSTWTTGSQTLQVNSLSSTLTAPTAFTLSADSTGCNASKVFAIGIHPIPTVQVNAQNSTICNGQSTTIFAQGASSYTWAYVPGLISSPFGPSVTVQPFLTTTYSLSGANLQGCISNATTTIFFGSFPAVSIFSTAAAVCAGFQSSITASGANQFFLRSAVAASSSVFPNFTAPAGNYTLVGNNGGSCLDSISFNIGVLPSYSITIQSSGAYTCIDDNGNPWPITLSTSGNLSYSWSPFNPAQMSSSVGAVIVVSPTTTACYTLTGFSNTCSGKKTVCVDYMGACTSIAKLDSKKEMLVYPTFVDDKFYIEESFSTVLHVAIFDVSGRKVLDFEANQQQAKQGFLISQLQAGNYLVEISSPQALVRKIIIKQ